MKKGIGVICALIFCRVFGYNLFISALFGAIGLLVAQMVNGRRLGIFPYAYFLLISACGVLGEIITALFERCTNQENFYGAWLIFVPTIFFLMFSPRNGVGRKIMGLGYAASLMLLYFYARPKIGDMASLSFFPMKIALLFVIIYNLKQKNGAS